MTKRAKKQILFLCTGNYYRSRFAEILFNSLAGRMGLPWCAISRALALERGINNIGPMAVSAIEALQLLGATDAEAVARFPLAVAHDDFEQAERVVALKQAEHLPLLQERFPVWVEKVEFWHVEDAPEALGVIEQEVMSLVARILGGGGPVPTLSQEQPPPKREPTKKAITVRVGRETKGRRGKGVTTIDDLPLGEAGLLELAALLKQRCGTGGTVREGRIEIQGDQRERLAVELEKLGYKVKRVGG